MGLVLVLVAVATLLPAAVMVGAGAAMLRRPSRVHRVPVEAVVVHFQNLHRAPKVTFDYPAPDGSWLRTTQRAGLIAMQRQGFLVRPGDRMTVWVDPARPRDVSLGEAGSAAGLGGIALVVFGAAWGLIGLTVVVSLAGRLG